MTRWSAAEPSQRGYGINWSFVVASLSLASRSPCMPAGIMPNTLPIAHLSQMPVCAGDRDGSHKWKVWEPCSKRHATYEEYLIYSILECWPLYYQFVLLHLYFKKMHPEDDFWWLPWKQGIAFSKLILFAHECHLVVKPELSLPPSQVNYSYEVIMCILE